MKRIFVPDKQYECVYNKMPVFGLAKAGSHVPAIGKRETASSGLVVTEIPPFPNAPNP